MLRLCAVVALVLSAQQFRQLGDIGCYSPGLGGCTRASLFGMVKGRGNRRDQFGLGTKTLLRNNALTAG
jgi:hypothetical protein